MTRETSSKKEKRTNTGKEIVIFRLSERGYRDLRITTHCALVARAWGARRILLSGMADPHIRETLQSINTEFGGDFEVEYENDLLKRLRTMKKEGYTLVHLTMYGESPPQVIPALRKVGRIAIVIGSEKVPGGVYQMADFNVGITRQPHSEVAALAVFLHYLQGGEEETFHFPNAKKIIIPNPKGKDIRPARDI
ncbi:MAG: tRNA (cytidine(56)-2'-O)-methyltransferase [archaeon]